MKPTVIEEEHLALPPPSFLATDLYVEFARMVFLVHRQACRISGNLFSREKASIMNRAGRDGESELLRV